MKPFLRIRDGRVKGFESVAPWALAVLIQAACAGCSDPDDLVSVAFREFHEDVECGIGGVCVGVDGDEVPGTDFICEGFMSSDVSRFQPGGVFLFWSYSSGGRYAEVELDFPSSLSGEVPAVTVLREFEGGEQVFHTDASRGIVNVTGSGTGLGVSGMIDYYGGSFELMFIDFGEDGEEGTDDDLLRFLRNGAFALPERKAAAAGGDYFYDDRYRGRWDTGVIFEIRVEDTETEDDYDSHEKAEGCEGDTCDDEDYEGSEGCEGDTYDDGYDDSGGCEGDSSDGSGDSGCSGDDWGGDTGGSEGGCDFDCEGDTYYSGGKGKKPRRSTWARLMPLFVPFVLRKVLGRKRRK